MTNPYLTIDKKYFKTSFEGQFIITLEDLVNMPELKNYVNVSYLIDSKINFDEFSIDEKITIGKIFFNYYHYIKWIGDKQYLDFNLIFDKFETSENLIYEIAKLNPNYYYKSDPETKLYLMDYVSNTFLLLLITLYFYSRYSITEESQKYIQYSETLTDIDYNLYQYNKLDQDLNFVLKIFGNWIRTSANTIPFAPGYGNFLKELVQEKNIIVKLNQVRANVINFFEEFSQTYPDLVQLNDVSVNIISQYGIEINISLTINEAQNTFNVLVEE
jgi:hypothetical protein